MDKSVKEEEKEEEEFSFEKLTPTTKADILVYKKAIDFVFKNPDIKNVAISGPYSSGKSSLLETYKVDNTNRKFLHISLAYFNKSNETDISQEKGFIKENETRLEGKILNQLIQQLDPSDIPLTNFRIKKTINKNGYSKLSLFIFSIILCLCYLILFPQWKKLVMDINSIFLCEILFITISPLFVMCVIAILLIFLYYIINKFVKEQKNKMIFRKFNFQGNEIEIFAEDDDSYFDKYLNEVLYLFENSGAEVIVFEDIDRYDDVLIFERLHEINRLTNLRISSKGEENHIIRFFYLIRDNIFDNKDRVKFFDFIIPVIPVIDSSNSYNRFKEYIENSNLLKHEEFDNKFIRGLSLYVDDLRILKNIYNELVIYYDMLKAIHPNVNMMLAMITYKNIFPKDFADLQMNQGFVFELFEQKRNLIKKQEEKYKSDLEMLKKRKETYSQKKYNGRKSQSQKETMRDTVERTLSDIESNIAIIEAEINKVKNLSFAELVTRENIDELFQNIEHVNPVGKINSFDEIKSNEYFDLLKYLIRNGYINETYNDYMSLFYTNSITVDDKIFLRSVTDKKAEPYDYKLYKIDNIIQYLKVTDFAEKETMNYDLFEHLLKTNIYAEQLKMYMTQLRQNGCHEFVYNFYNLKSCHSELIWSIGEYWSEFFRDIVRGYKWPEEEIRKFSLEILSFIDSKRLRDINIDNCLTEYISERDDFLMLESNYSVNIGNRLIDLGVKFRKIKTWSDNYNLFTLVYENSLYQINMDNILLMLSEKYENLNAENSVENCLSNILSQPNTPLWKYYDLNASIFINLILDANAGVYMENEKTFLEVINREEISDEIKARYLNKNVALISDIESVIQDSYKKKLMELKRFKYSAHNIFSYYKLFDLTEELIRFVNSKEEKMLFTNKEMSDEKIIDFQIACIREEKLNEERFKEILKKINKVFKEFAIYDVSGHRMNILIEYGLIPMTESTLYFMREYYRDNLLRYIEKNIDEYIEIITYNSVPLDEILEILKVECNVDNEKKIKILSTTTQSISVKHKNYDSELILYILKHNFYEDDFIYLCNQYFDYNLRTMQAISNLCSDRIVRVIENLEQVDDRLLEDLVKNKSINLEDRIKLLSGIKDTSEIAIYALERCLEGLGCKELQDIFLRDKSIEIQMNALNEKVLDVLKKMGWVKSYEKNTDLKIFTNIIMTDMGKSN